MWEERLNRRVGDLNRDQMDEMIANEEDKKIRSVLLVAQNLISALGALTQLMNDLDDRFQEHKEDYDRKVKRDSRIIVQAQTVYKGATALLFVAQSLVLGLGIYGYQAFVELQDQVARSSYQIEDIIKWRDKI